MGLYIPDRQPTHIELLKSTLATLGIYYTSNPCGGLQYVEIDDSESESEISFWFKTDGSFHSVNINVYGD